MSYLDNFNNDFKSKFNNYITKFPSDSKIWGPGVWWTIHVQALHANSKESINKYIEYIEFILPKLPCMKCRNHATEYLSKNRPENYIEFIDNDGELTGMFYWSWKFHNTVNTRLNKDIIDDYYVAKNLYDEDEFCTDDCGN